jgi:hypothetical protein
MRVLKILFLLLAGLSAFKSTAQIEPEDIKPIFRELRALEGTWFMSTDRGDRLEIWYRMNDSTLAGRSVRIKPENGDTVTLELLRLERHDTSITYVTIARGQNKNEPVKYTLTAADYEGYLFENPQHDDPQKIRYLLLGNRELQVTTEGKKGSRTVKDELVFEREFAPGAVEFNLRAGINAHTLRTTGNYSYVDSFSQGWRPSWEIGTVTRFRGRGGFITINAELGLVGKSAKSRGYFFGDTVFYSRDLNYNTVWLKVALVPEITLKRDGRLSLIAGPYLARLLGSGGKGTILPTGNDRFKANNDFKKTDIGLVAGFQYKLNLGKKDLGGVLGLRANFGLKDVDNLYKRDSNNPSYYNGQISFLGASLYYTVNLLKL